MENRLDEISGPHLKNKVWKDSSTQTASGGGGKKPPKKPRTKTGGLPDKEPGWDPDKNSGINPSSFMSIGSNHFDEVAQSEQRARDRYMIWKKYNGDDNKKRRNGY